MLRDTMSASSRASSAYLEGLNTTENPKYDIWNLITRQSLETPYCMTCKYRTGARIKRIRDDTVRRSKCAQNVYVTDKRDDESTTSSDDSNDWGDLNDGNDDFVNPWDSSMTSSGGLVTQTKYNRCLSRISGDLLSDIVESGGADQKLYLKKCMDFEIAPSMLFIRSLPSDTIDVGHQRLGPKGIKTCALALYHNITVETLHMNDNDMGHKGAKYLTTMLKENRTILDLNLANNDIGSRGVAYLLPVLLQGDMIEKLDLSGNNLKDDDATLFKRCIEDTKSLQYLNLSHNNFREAGGRLLGEGIENNGSLVELDLSWNHLRHTGATGLLEGLTDNRFIKVLNLAWNGLGLEGCRALRKTLTFNKTLTVLDLTNNRINRECIKELIRGLAKNSTLKELVLKFNPLTTLGVQDLMDFLVKAHDSGITTVDFGIQQVDPLCVARVNETRLQGRAIEVRHGHVIGNMTSSTPQLEKDLIREHPALILMEYGKLMGFRLMDLFTSMDKTGSRTLSSEEIRNGLTMANVPFSEDLIHALVEKLDDDGDGEVDFSDLLVAQQEHRRQMLRMLEAEKSGHMTDLESTPLRRIRTHLQRIMAEKMTDYAAFRRAADQIAKHVQRTSDQMEAEQEKATLDKVRRPRQVKSRPPSISANEIKRKNDVMRPYSTSAVSQRSRIGQSGTREELLIRWAEPVTSDVYLEERPRSMHMRKRGSCLSSTDVSESTDTDNFSCDLWERPSTPSQ